MYAACGNPDTYNCIPAAACSKTECTAAFPVTFKKDNTEWPKLKENEVLAYEYYLDKKKCPESLEKKIARENNKRFLNRYAEFNDRTKRYEVSALKDWLGEDVKLKVEPTNDGKLIISNFKIPIPDLAHEYKEKYDARVKALKDEHMALVKSYCAPNKWALRGPIIISVLLAVVLLIFMLIYFTKSPSNNTNIITDNSTTNSWYIWLILGVIVVIGIIAVFVYFLFKNRSSPKSI